MFVVPGVWEWFHYSGRQIPSANREFYEYPLSSSRLGFFVVKLPLAGPLQSFPVDDVAFKAVKIPIPNSTDEFAVIKLLHCDAQYNQ